MQFCVLLQSGLQRRFSVVGEMTMDLSMEGNTNLTLCEIIDHEILDGASIWIVEVVEHGAGDDDGLLVEQKRGGDDGCLGEIREMLMEYSFSL
jgi:hypothetical protein